MLLQGCVLCEEEPVTQTKLYDVAIIGGGPGGSTLGTLLAKKKLDVVLFEKEAFPRFCIGESLLPYSMDVFRESGIFETLNSGKYLKKYGARFVDCESNEEVHFNFENGVESSQNFAFEVPREEFDQDLLEWAIQQGVKVFQPEKVVNLEFLKNHVEVSTTERKLQARFLVDASGGGCFLGNRLKIKKPIRDLNNVAVFAHYDGVKRMSGKKEGDITIGILADGGWVWIIPFLGTRTSVGVVLPAKNVKQSECMDSLIMKTISESRILREKMENAKQVGPTRTAANFSHSCSSLVGDRWLLLGDAAVFLDPVFSSGVHMVVWSAKFASEALAKVIDSNSLLTGSEGRKYEALVQKGIGRFHSLVSLFYSASFVRQMKKTIQRPNVGSAFTTALSRQRVRESSSV